MAVETLRSRATVASAFFAPEQISSCTIDAGFA
jgi:hypothetical protein